MANSFAESIMSNMLSSLDPNVAMQQKALDMHLKSQADAVLTAKAERIESVGSKLIEACANNAPSSVIAAYERILTQLTS